jgi:hypothetical protein
MAAIFPILRHVYYSNISGGMLLCLACLEASQSSGGRGGGCCSRPSKVRA